MPLQYNYKMLIGIPPPAENLHIPSAQKLLTLTGLHKQGIWNTFFSFENDTIKRHFSFPVTVNETQSNKKKIAYPNIITPPHFFDFYMDYHSE